MVDRVYSDPRLAALYDRLYPSQGQDFNFYLPMMMEAKAVLDVGCGTGAMLHAARRAGHTGRLCGLDPGVGMLAQARKHADIEWFLGDLTSVTWTSDFDLVVMTGHVFQVLLEDHDLRAALATVRRVLRHGGRFAFETRNPAARAWENWTAERDVEITDGQGFRVRVTQRVETPFNGRSISFIETFTSDEWDQPRVSRSTLRFLPAEAIGPFLTEAGLMIEQQFGDWDRKTLMPESPEIITVARALTPHSK